MASLTTVQINKWKHVDVKPRGPEAKLVILGHITGLFSSRSFRVTLSRQGWHEVRPLDDKAVICRSCVREKGGECVGQVTWRLHVAEVVESSRWTFLKVIRLVLWLSYVYTHSKMTKARGVWDLNSFWWMRGPLGPYCPTRDMDIGGAWNSPLRRGEKYYNFCLYWLQLFIVIKYI